jgi:carboxymethylenebutenolidase
MLATRKKWEDPMDQRIINLWDNFTHGGMNRREFLDRLTELAGSAAAGAALLPLLQCNYANAATVPENDPRLAFDRVSYDSPKGKIKAYLARPNDKGKRPAVIVIHQNRGLNPHIEDVARRVALEGFLTFAPDLLSVNGGTPPDDDKARDLYQKTEREDMIAAALAAVPLMLGHAESTGKVGAVGFCFGGGVINRLAAGSPDLAAVVAYYGAQIPAAMVTAIKAPLLLHYAANDDNINKGIDAYEAALKANGKRYTIYSYPGTQHAFNDDTAGVRYNKEQADIAWGRTIAFFKQELGAPPKAS